MKFYLLFFGIFFVLMLYIAKIMLWYKDNNKEANSTINEFCSNENNLKNVN